MSRHVYVQRADTRGLTTWDQRAERSSADHGVVEEARYLRCERRGWLARLFPRLFPPPPASDLRFVLPFDEAGDDVLGLCDEVAWLGGGDAVGTLRRIRGTIVCLEPRAAGDEVVLRDIWITRPPILRVVEAVDFAVLPASGDPVAIFCAMAPLVVAVPSRMDLATFAGELGPRARAILHRDAARRGSVPAACLRLCEGDEVEVSGLVYDGAAAAPRFEIASRSTSYRGAPRRIELALGDEPGTRLLIRVLRAAPGR